MGNNLSVVVGCANRSTPYFATSNGEGLAVFELDTDSLSFDRRAVTACSDNPTFASVSRDGRHIYATTEVFEWREGLITAYRYEPENRSLVYLNTQPTLGSIAAHSSITRDGKWLLLVNYAMGTGGPDCAAASYRINEDGSLSSAVGTIALEGSGPNQVRQERSHPHSINAIGDTGFVVVCDLGTDLLHTYLLNDAGAFEPRSSVQLPSGSGPRHAVVSPNGEYVFVTSELASTVASFAVDRATGALSSRDTISSLPDGTTDESYLADIAVSPDGAWVYCSNRGHDSIAVVGVGDDGELTPDGHVPSGGKTPRSIAMNSTGDLIICANQDSDRVSIFRRNGQNGRLEDTGTAIPTGTPTCVRIRDVV